MYAKEGEAMRNDPEEFISTRTVFGDGWTCELRQHYRYQNPTTEPDPDWSFSDATGHVHRYERQPDGTLTTPTLIGSSKVETDSEGDEWTEHFLVCLECGERIEPGRRRVPQPAVKYMFSGSYEGNLSKSVIPMCAGVPIDVEVMVPGFSGPATVIRIGTTTSAGKPTRCAIDFQGDGALSGFDQP